MPPARRTSLRLAPTARRRAETADGQPRLERIRAAARQHFAERGFAAASMRAIAAYAGITISTLYFHCTTKEQLLFDVLMDGMHQLSQGLRASIDAAAPTWADRLTAAIAFHVQFCAEQAFGTAVSKTDLLDLTPEHRAQYVAVRDEYERQFRDLIRWGIAVGEFRRVDPVLASFALIGIGQTVGRWYQPGGRLTPAEIGAQYAELMLHALRGEAAALPA